MNIDTIDIIVSYLQVNDIKKCLFVSKNIYNSIKLNNNLWLSICNKYFKLPGNYFQFRSIFNSTIYLQCITNATKYKEYYKSTYIIEKNKKITIGDQERMIYVYYMMIMYQDIIVSLNLLILLKYLSKILIVVIIHWLMVKKLKLNNYMLVMKLL